MPRSGMSSGRIVVTITLATVLWVWPTVRAGMAAPSQPSGWVLVVLGIAQDGGIPHLGCQQQVCVDARAGRRPTEKVASLGLVHRASGRAFLFDATPDLPSQLEALTAVSRPTGSS